jgi:hypothetical protein
MYGGMGLSWCVEKIPKGSNFSITTGATRGLNAFRLHSDPEGGRTYGFKDSDCSIMSK